jgi:hypothetical protein
MRREYRVGRECGNRAFDTLVTTTQKARQSAKWHSVTGVIKYAAYDAQAFATDTRKFWLQVEYVL